MEHQTEQVDVEDHQDIEPLGQVVEGYTHPQQLEHRKSEEQKLQTLPITLFAEAGDHKHSTSSVKYSSDTLVVVSLGFCHGNSFY